MANIFTRLLLAILLTAPLTAFAQFTTPNVINVAGDITNTLGSTTFINHGLVGVGRISASALDGFAETFGSISGLQITGWTNNGNGSYSGTFNILPDRGFNKGNFYSEYGARINRVGFTFTPYTGPTNLGGTTVAEKLARQNQIAFTTPITGVKFTYDDPTTGASYTTGLEPGTNSATLFGRQLPYVPSYTGYQSPSSTGNTTYSNINKLPLDSEALVLKSDGSGYIGDEYGPNLYYFDTNKKITGMIVPPAAIQPHSPAGTLNFTSTTPPVNGRRDNHGFEGVSLSPDGSRLFALLQSATIQDSDTAADQTRTQTRLLVYDVSHNPTNNTPLKEFALTLPTYKANGNGGAVNKTAAQSDIIALDNNRFLVIARDGNGLGNTSLNPSMYKSVLLVDTSIGTPTNFVNDAARNVEGGMITTSPGVLDDAITPLSWTEVVNLLNSSQLNKFNIALDTGSAQVTKLTLSEKWEGMTLAPANDSNNPNDYFLFIGNDNDFLTSAGQIRGPDGTIVSFNGFSGYPATRIPAPVDTAYNENDSMILAFRVSITLTPPPAVDLAISLYPGPHAGLTVTGGVAGHDYSIVSTTNLNGPVIWTTEAVITQGVSGVVWIDPISLATILRKFYNVTDQVGP